MKYLGSISDDKDLVNKGYVDDSIEAGLEAVFKWLGVTTTSITDGSSTNPIIINNESVTAVEGSVVGYNNSEFLFDGSNWKELGKDEPIAFESFSGPSSVSTATTFTYGSYTYYKGYKGSVISAFPHYTGSSFRLEMESSIPTVPPTINTYDGYYVSYSSGGTTYPIICAGTGDESSITTYPLYLIVITTESGSKYYTIYSRSSNNTIPAWILYEENKNKEIIIEQELKEDSTNLVTNGAVAKNINGLNEEVGELKSAIDKTQDDLGVYDVGTMYNTLDSTYNRVMAVYPIRDVNDTFYYKISDKSTNGNVNIRICSAASPYNAALLETADTIIPAVTEQEGSFVISSASKTDAKYIVILHATANVVVSFKVALWAGNSIASELKDTTYISDLMNSASQFEYDCYIQGGVNGTTGNFGPNDAVVVTRDFINIDELIAAELKANKGLRTKLFSYDDDFEYLGSNDLPTAGFYYSAKQISAYRTGVKYVKIQIWLDAGGDFSPSDFALNGGFILTLTSLLHTKNCYYMNVNTNTDFSNLLRTVGKTPMASWVDDDGEVTAINNRLLPVIESVGIPVTFAVTGALNTNVTVGGETSTRAEYFQGLQKKGHQIISHPTHTYWYGANYDITKVNPSLIESLTELQSYGFLHSDMLVYPGSSGTNADVVEIVRKWCLCGVLSGYGTPNHLGDSGKWGIKRVFVNFEDYDSIHSGDAGYVSAMAWYKKQVDDAYNHGDWIVFGTHSYQFTVDSDTTDPNANTTGNLEMLMQYTVDKGLQFRTLWDAYNRRKYFFEFNEINQ